MYGSHDEQVGKPITAHHPYAVVVRTDPGFDDMQSVSGDDWLSGAQSIGACLRGALIAGLMAAHGPRMG